MSKIVTASDILKMEFPPLDRHGRLRETTENVALVLQYNDIRYPLPVDEAIRRHDISPVVERFGTWVVTTYGVECLAAYYPIEKSRLSEERRTYDWLDHMIGKEWVVLGDFKRALDFGRKWHAGRDTSLRVRFLVLKRDDYRCQLCGRDASDGIKLEVAHKLARAHGGPYTPDNLWTLCFDCNRGQRTDEP